jgi:hypothetical protein
MDSYFEVEHLAVDRLLADWRWLCVQHVKLIAKSAFGDLFLCDDSGVVFKLDVTIGKMLRLAASEEEFRELAMARKNRQEWFAEDDELAAAEQGLQADSTQCIAFKLPLVFAESGSLTDAYVADLYEYVSFLGDVHRQMSSLPDGSTVKLRVKQ